MFRAFLLIFLLVFVFYQVEAEPRGGRGGGGRSSGGRSSYSSSSRSSYSSSRSSYSSRSSSSSSSSRRSWFSRSSSSSRPSSSSRSSSSLGSRAAGARRFSLFSSSGGSRWVAPSSARKSSFSSLKPIVERVRHNRKATKWGTKFSSPSTLDRSLKTGYSKKQLGMAAGAGFIGGSAFGHGSSLASYSVYHRYQRYRWYRHRYHRHHYHVHDDYYYDDDDYWDNYYPNNYEKNECEYGCPQHTHCEWGFCECDPGYVKAWGVCRVEGMVAPEPEGRRIEGVRCDSSAECQAKDVNLVCRQPPVKPGNSSTVGVSTTTAATTDTSGTTCQCRRDMRWNTKALECQLFIDVDCKNVTYSSTVSDQVKAAAETLETTLGNATIEIPTNRTQTGEESLKESLLSVITASDNATLEVLNEAFCRDAEAFSEAFQVDDTINRPPNCQPIDNNLCAVLYDSSTCAEGTWKLPIYNNANKRLRYWSSDYKYRNDADVIGVRNGCTFFGWTGSGFNGNSFKLTAGATDRWIVFAESQLYKQFDESILSFRCACRT